MPSIITDDMVKKMCFTSRPIPVQAIGVLDPNRKIGSKPNFIRKRGRSGIKPVQLPIYAPASVGGLVQSICNITKLEPPVVEKYLENAIAQEMRSVEITYDGDIIPLYSEFETATENEIPDQEVQMIPSSAPVPQADTYDDTDDIELYDEVVDLIEASPPKEDVDAMSVAVERGQ